MEKYINIPGYQGIATQSLLKTFPQHIRYIDVFGGIPHLFAFREKETQEIFNDEKGLLHNFREIIKNDESLDRMLQILNQYPNNSLRLNRAIEILRDFYDEPYSRYRLKNIDVNMGFAFFVATMCCDDGWSWNTTYCIFKNEDVIITREMLLEHANLINNRFRNVFVECEDPISLLLKYDIDEVLFYIEPYDLYFLNRNSKKFHDSFVAQRELLKTILKLEAKIIIKCPRNNLYKNMLYGWNIININKSTLWTNFDVKKPDFIIIERSLF